MLTGLDDRGVAGTEWLSGGDPDSDRDGLSSSSSVGSRTSLFFFTFTFGVGGSRDTSRSRFLDSLHSAVIESDTNNHPIRKDNFFYLFPGVS